MSWFSLTGLKVGFYPESIAFDILRLYFSPFWPDDTPFYENFQVYLRVMQIKIQLESTLVAVWKPFELDPFSKRIKNSRIHAVLEEIIN